MTYYEMSLLQTEMKLDEVHDQLTLLKKNKDLIDAEYAKKLKEERELDVKARRLKKFYEKHQTLVIILQPNLALNHQIHQ